MQDPSKLWSPRMQGLGLDNKGTGQHISAVDSAFYLHLHWTIIYYLLRMHFAGALQVRLNRFMDVVGIHCTELRPQFFLGRPNEQGYVNAAISLYNYCVHIVHVIKLSLLLMSKVILCLSVVYFTAMLVVLSLLIKRLIDWVQMFRLHFPDIVCCYFNYGYYGFVL